MTGAEKFLVKWASDDDSVGLDDVSQLGPVVTSDKRIPVFRLSRLLLQSQEGAIAEAIATLEKESPAVHTALKQLLKSAVR